MSSSTRSNTRNNNNGESTNPAGGGGGTPAATATCSRSSSARSKSKHSARVVAQTPADAKLHAEFEQSPHFDYHSSSMRSGDAPAASADVSSYLQSMQRGKYIQPFGCLLAIDEDTFAVLAYSENAHEMLDLTPHAVPSIEQRDALAVGTDARSLFRSQSSLALQKAASFAEVTLLNPILVHCRSTGKPFYAILHRVDVGLVIDLEPVNPTDVPVTAAGALKSYKLAAKAISRLQSLPSGNLSLLCDVLVREVSELTGYDRVMAYKFHEDEHGEVIAECRRSDLEPYLGLHFPATDIPQASRFLFMKNKVRMICDCHASPIKVLQNEKLGQPLSLCGSTLRAPHGCHAQYMANMGSIASLVMSVTVSEDDDGGEVGSGPPPQQQQRGMKLWGLVVCHHTSPRFVPFPLRYACEFLLQVFGIQLNKEVELSAQAKERHILKIQTLLCDMLLRNSPVGIFTQSPTVLDLVKCDGAALYFRGQFTLLGTTPSEVQIRDIVGWMLENHDGSTGLSTDSLMEAGYPGAAALGDAVCGMAAIRISSKDFVFWFRSHTAKEIKWGGAKHEPETDAGRKMHPRSSFKTFLEVVRWRSIPWEDVEMDAIHSLQVILRSSVQEEIRENNATKSIVRAAPSEDSKQLQGLNELRMVTNEMVRLIETANVPILAVDLAGSINGWNRKAAELTGLPVEGAIGTAITQIVEDESVEVVNQILRSASQGKEEQLMEIKFKTFNEQKDDGPVILMVNACCSRDVNEKVVGICFVAQDLTTQKMVMDKYTRIKGDLVAIVRNPNELIPPIFMVSELGVCSEWNDAMQKLTGVRREEAVDRLLVGEVFTYHTFGCRVKDNDTLTKLSIFLNSVIAGQDPEKMILSFFEKSGRYVETLLSANRKTDAEGKVTGVLCFLHVASAELQHALQVQKVSEWAAVNSLKELTYIRQELQNPLNGMKFTHNLLQSSNLSEEQSKLLAINTLCRDQLRKILDDRDLESIEQCYTEMNLVEFNLGEALDAVMMQGVGLSKERRVRVNHEWPLEVAQMRLYGDSLRLQQVLSDFLACAVQFARPSDGPVLLRVVPRKEQIGTLVQIVHLEFRIIHPAPGVPEALIQEMFHHNQGVSREGLGLYMNQKLVKIMSGTVQYLREAERSTFIVMVEFPVAEARNKSR